MRKKLVVAMMSMVLATGNVLPAYANILRDDVININNEIQQEGNEEKNKQEEVIEEQEEIIEEQEKVIEEQEEVIEEQEEVKEIDDEVEIRGMSSFSLSELEQDIIDNPDKYFKHTGNTLEGFNTDTLTKELMKNVKILILPSEISGKKIEVIDEEAFNPIENKWIQISGKLIVPDSVKVIKKGAFSENKITELELSNSLEVIEKSAFAKNIISGKLIIPDSVLDIDNYAFENNKITELELSNSLEVIKNYIFENNEISGILTIPDSVVEIEKNAFANNNIIDVEFPKTLNKIGDHAFANNNIKEPKLPENLEEIGWSAFLKNGTTKLIMPNSVKKMTSFAFADNDITELKLSDSLEEISNGVFQNNKITELNLPNKLRVISFESFKNNKIVELRLPEYLEEIDFLAFANNEIKELVIDKNLLEIDQFAFICYDENSKEVFNYIEKMSMSSDFGKENIAEDTFGNLNNMEYLELGSNVNKSYKEISDLEMPKLKKIVQYNPMITLVEDDLVGNIEVVGFKKNNVEGIKSFTSNNLLIKDNKTQVSYSDNKIELEYDYIVNEEDKVFEKNKRIVDRPIDLDIVIDKIPGTKFENIKLTVAGEEVNNFQKVEDDKSISYKLPKDIYYGDRNSIKITADLVVDTTKDFNEDEIKISPKVIAKSEDGNTKEDIIGNNIDIKVDKSQNPPIDPEKPSKPEEKPSKPSKPNRPNKDKNKEEKNENKKEESKDIEEKFNIFDHFEYINGYEDNTVRPESNITREEASAVIYRILNPEYRNSIKINSSSFNDIKANRWSSKHIGTLEKGKLINGYEDHSFKAEKNMTRAEVTTLLAKFAPGEISGAQNFKDVKGHWAEKHIGYAVSKGWIKGYEDNSFRPDEEITRAEFVSIVNNVLGRHTKVENMTLDKKEYKDLDKNKWYYADIEEAVNGHKQKIEEGQEKWVELTHYDIEM